MSVKEGYIDFFGKKLIDTTLQIDKKAGQKLALPFQFNFNSGWKFTHSCCNCKSDVYISENFETKNKNFKIIPNIDSSNYDISLVKRIALLFKSLDAINVDGIFYLNRNDFDYTFDFQRQSSVHLTCYYCFDCRTEYLGVIRIGYPLIPEKNIPLGKLGQIHVIEVVSLETKDGLLSILNKPAG